MYDRMTYIQPTTILLLDHEFSETKRSRFGYVMLERGWFQHTTFSILQCNILYLGVERTNLKCHIMGHSIIFTEITLYPGSSIWHIGLVLKNFLLLHDVLYLKMLRTHPSYLSQVTICLCRY